MLNSISSFVPTIQSSIERLKSTKIELDDISTELESISDDTAFNEVQMQEITNRLHFIYSLQTKHKVESISELLILKETWVKTLELFHTFDKRIEELNKEILTIKSKLKELARKLANSRKSVFPVVEERVENLLKNLGIPHARFQVSHAFCDELNPYGQDSIQFMFSANKNLSLQPIKKVASGGEISRLMLCLKYINANANNQSTIMFDEIDSGLSGKIAQKMGEIMKQMAKVQQIICITHLPQIASQGKEHFLVYKKVKEKCTIIQLKSIESNERVEEIAKMLSGTRVTEFAMKNAKELLQN